MSLLGTESYATLMALTQCCTENGNVGLTQPTTTTYIEVKMDLEKEARAFMKRKYEEMNFEEYQKDAKETAIYPSNLKILYPALGLAGEAGEVANKVKKIARDHKGKMPEDWRHQIASEIGDVLWYCSALASDINVPLGEIAYNNLQKLGKRKKSGTIGGSGDSR